ncbi:hypothetical protein COF68_04795 [Bacillus toyonensis]|uniref:FHA domain-containing protein n=1 Tax=Bacillus toyonensis TaxID=155322 RepID=UPI000BFC4566|nr:FHA domain-containing protein [Bacillus toyonensis]PHE64169.1 hypothetical protein COF68_04795 [Bacillus toyonensis]
MGFIKLIKPNNVWTLRNELEKKEVFNEELAKLLNQTGFKMVLPFELVMEKKKRVIISDITGRYSLLVRLQQPIDSREVVIILKGLLDAFKNALSNNIPMDYIDLDLDYIFINRETESIELTMWAIDGLAHKTSVPHIFQQIGMDANPKASKDKKFLEGYLGLFDENFTMERLDVYISKAYSMLQESVDSDPRYRQEEEVTHQEVAVTTQEDVIEQEKPQVAEFEPEIVEQKVEEQPETELEPDLEQSLEPELEPELATTEEEAPVEPPVDEVEEEEMLLPTDKTTFLFGDEDEEEDGSKTTILAEEEEELLPYLIRVKDDSRFDFNDDGTYETVVGKLASSDIYISDNSTISRSHAMFKHELGMTTIEDLGSANGTYLNGRKLSANKVEQVFDGDIIKFAKEEFEYHEG